VGIGEGVAAESTEQSGVMTPEEWQRIRSVVEKALDSPPGQRAAVVDEACSGDADLRLEVEALLESKDGALSSFLESPISADGLNASLDEIVSPARLQAGQVFAGRFVLVRRLGEGGMGQVWLAEQTAPVRRQVALKLIRAGMYDEAAAQRFQAERQSLAVMEHPAIAKIFDAGMTAQGQPYFVMEYVPGLPITKYCDQRTLSIRGRLELFIQACEGVQHAHQKAIIHRDLKPANILVVEVDGKPVPRIIDFGLAKAVRAQSDGENSFTEMGHFVGTPGYMSPEQAYGSGKHVDTRTDVYSLGVVLYMLLTGARPLDAKAGEKMPLEELLRRLRQDDPPSPSTRVSSDREASTSAAEARGTNPRQLAGLLRGDLDWITLKALEKDPERRYATPLDLSADIERYMDHRPVRARPASASYRARKYARRHRVALGVAALIVTVMLVATIVSLRESMRANREARVAEAVNNFLQNDLLAQASSSAQSGPNTKPDPDLKVRTALDRAAERIEGKFANQPEVEAAIRDTMGRTYADLGLYPEAGKQLERALELRKRVLGPNDPNTLRTMSRLGMVAYSEGKYAEAEALEKQALEAQRRRLGPEHPDTLQAMHNLAQVYFDEGKYAEAEALDTQILEIRKRVLGADNPDTLRSMNNLALVYHHEHKYPQAEALDTQALAILTRIMGPEHPDTLKAMNNLALVYDYEGKYAQAEELDTQTLEIKKRALGPEHPSTLQSMLNLAIVYAHEGKYTQAQELYIQTYDIQKRVMGADSPNTATTLYNLGCVAARSGDKDQAIARLRQSVDHGLPPRVGLGMETDSALVSLHGDPRFTALVAHAKQVAETKQH
jgi:eukaryotic-like serine/threonine-protein kinase